MHGSDGSMKLQEAEQIAIEITGLLKQHFLNYTVCGSIRRKQEEVNDVDIVAIPKPISQYHFGDPTLNDTIIKLDSTGSIEAYQMGKRGVSRFLLGDNLKRFFYKGIMIDLYLASSENYSCLTLIRTGSADHNRRLATLAIGKGLKLFANGDGLCTFKMKDDKAVLVNVVQNSEEGILQHLLGRIPKPEERN